MKMKYLISILVLFLLAAGLGGYTQSQNIKLRDQVASLQEQVIALESQNEILETQKENLSVEVGDLKSETEALKEVINNLKDLFLPLNTFGTQATVVRVKDGDTIVVSIDGTIYDVRYIGIDTPEFGEPWADEATEFNKELVEGKTVWLEKDISETDRYNRLLRYVYVGDIFVNAELVSHGLARAKAYEPDTKYQAYFEGLEAEAREAGLGIWTVAGE